ncbi:MAG: DUF4832 domain-containing protein [Lentisphaeria bacterium]|nr:DUF4832 domain-containing protein [Lentisphaeria bacterium]
MRKHDLQWGQVQWGRGILMGAALLGVPAFGEPAMVSVRLKDNGAELRNPGMGWVLHYYDNVPAHYGSRLRPADTLPDWPGLNLIYLRIPWSYVEPEEGHFDWSVLDTPMQRFADRGVPAALRLTCSESWMRYATPRWVEEAGAKGYSFRPGAGIVPDGPFWEPDYDDPVFLDKLDRFLGAVARRYDGNPGMAFIDVGSFGVWGEGHTWSSTRKEYPKSTIIKHIDMHRKHFRKTMLIGMDDFLSRPGTAIPLNTGTQTRSFDLVLPREWRSREFRLLAGLWQPGRAEQQGRLRPVEDSSERRTAIATLRVAEDGRPRAEAMPVPWPPNAAWPADGTDFAVRFAGLRHDPAQQPHSLKVDLEIAIPGTPPASVRPFLHLLDGPSGATVFAPHEEREDEELTAYMADNGLGLRDDSILVGPPPAAYFHAAMAQGFWRRAPVVLECEHYGGSRQRGCWQDGSGFLQAVEDYHASYASIHWWPDEFLEGNRDLVRDINRRLGYRLMPVEVGFTAALTLGEPFTVRWEWRNDGVAPPYRDLFPAVTLRDREGGLAAVLVDDATNLRDLDVTAAGVPPARFGGGRFRLPFQLGSGVYEVLVSVGDRAGRPLIALPVDGGDPSLRYRVGECRIAGDYALRVTSASASAAKIVLQLVWEVHRPLPETAVPFFHLERGGTLLHAASPPAAAAEVAALRRPGTHRLSAELPCDALGTGDRATILAGIWVPERIGREDERLIPDSGTPDRRVLVGYARMEGDQLTVTPTQTPGP